MASRKENRQDSASFTAPSTVSGSDATSSSGPVRREVRSYSFWMALILAAAAFFRFYDLGFKPPHFDEGINGHFVLSIWRDGFYKYDPTNFHGPLYFYLCHLAEILFGRSVDSFRIMNAALSVGVIAIVFQFKRFVGVPAVVAAAILAVSPAFTFYGRYAIHETLFILGQVVFIFGRFIWFSRPDRQAIVWMVSGIVILISTKETFFIFLGTWIIAELVIAFLERREGGESWSKWKELSPLEKRQRTIDVVYFSIIGLFVTFLLFSGFFENPAGLRDFFRAFDFWSKTGQEGNGHDKPFFYWVSNLYRYELPLLVGLFVAPVAALVLHRDHKKLRLLLLFGFGHTLAYSLIPYKTPWLILNFWSLAFLFPARAASGWFVPLSALLIFSSVQTYRLNFINAVDPTEPYVYVQTKNDYSDVMAVLKEKVRQAPETRNTMIVVMIKDPWPLPYDLSLFPKVRYARLEDIDRDPSLVKNAGLMLIDGSILEGLRNILPKRFARMKFELRDAYGSGWALFDEDLFLTALPPGVEIEAPK